MKKKLNSKVYIGVISIILLLILVNQDRPDPQIIVDVECFEDIDCIVPIPDKYCGIDYGCAVGKCYSESELCPEICNSGIDEDLDDLIDCNDYDCWDNPLCSCNDMSFNNCRPNRCYCQLGTEPRWIVSDIRNICRCLSPGVTEYEI